MTVVGGSGRCDNVTAMLAELRIAGLGVIDDAFIEPAPGLTVVTGETGAGKTMIVTALGLVCGGRADSGRVRKGAKAAVLEARFSPDPAGRESRRSRGTAAAQHLADAAESVGGDIDDDGSLVVVRSVSADGRSRAHVGGRSAPVSALTEVTEPLVAVHGQAEAMTLLRPTRQRAVLDGFAGLNDRLESYRAVRAQWLSVRADIERHAAASRDRAQRETLLRLGVDEIDRVAPQPGEDRDIVAEVRRLEDADTLRQWASTAQAALVGSMAESAGAEDASAAMLVQQAIRTLEVATDPSLHVRLDDLRGALAVLSDVGADIVAYLNDLNAEPARLQILLERQSSLRGLTRKYGADIDEVLAWARSAREELAQLDSSDRTIAELEDRAAELGREVLSGAKAISTARTKAARELGAAASAELRHLAMGKATLTVQVTPLPEPGPDGADHVEILLATHGGAPELPVARSASGGELSRIMLALEVVLAGADPVSTLVFDEVDAGVGGRAATEIGSRLARLARDHQVIVVTHLAQVAAFADRHYVVDADSDGRVGASAVRPIDGGDRLAELARMLGGTDGATALAHASELRTAAVAT